VHLDFSSKSVRLQQIDELTAVLNQPDSEGLNTYKVEGEVLSDHKAVGASIYWREAE
jgi:hypothetical protein